MLTVIATYIAGFVSVCYGAYKTRDEGVTTVARTVKYAATWPLWLTAAIVAVVFFAIEAVVVHVREKRANPMVRFFKD